MNLSDVEKLEVGDKIYTFMKMTRTLLTYIYVGDRKFKQEKNNISKPKELKESELKYFSLDIDEQYIELYKTEKEDLENKLKWHKDQLSAIESKIKILEDGYGYLKNDYPEHFI